MIQTVTISDGRRVDLVDVDAMSADQTLRLATAAADVLVRSGQIRDDVALTGPQLVMFLNELGDWLASNPFNAASPAEIAQVEETDPTPPEESRGWDDPDPALSADRFRAVAGLSGIVMHGSAGFDARTGEPTSMRPGDVHFGAELTSVRNGHSHWGHLGMTAMAHDVLRVEAAPVPDGPVGTSVVDDAIRWRALMRLPRIRVMGHAGIRSEDGARVVPSEPGTFRFRAEFWSKGPGDAQTEPTLGRLCLAALADDIIAAERARQTKAPRP
jgi:hypothetical protein